MGLVVVMLAASSGVSCVPTSTLSSSTSSTTTSTSSTTTSSAGGGSDDVTPTPARDSKVASTTLKALPMTQTHCVLVALDPFLAGRVHDLVTVEEFSLLEYQLVFPNHTANPLKHNMKNAFKVVATSRILALHACD